MALPNSETIEKIPAHDWFHCFPVHQSILEIPIKQYSKRRQEATLPNSAPLQFRRFYAKSFTQSGAVQMGQLKPALDFIKSISNPAISPYTLVSIHLIKPNITSEFSIDAGAWFELVKAVQGTVSDIYVDHVNISGPEQPGSQPMPLPIPLPRLKRFKIEHAKIRLSRAFIDNLVKCPQLKYVYMELNIEQEEEEWLSALNRIPAQVRVDIQFWLWLRRGHADEVFDGSSGFKGLALIADKISDFDLCIDCWDPRLPPALTQFVNRCENLQKLSIKKLDPCKDSRGADRNLEAEFASLFRDQQRASKLRELKWSGECNDKILELIFGNCLFLDKLAISDCPQLRQEYFSIWNARSVKPQLPKYIYDGGRTMTSVASTSCAEHPSGASNRPTIQIGPEPLQECDTCSGLVLMELLPNPMVSTPSTRRGGNWKRQWCCC